MNEDAVAVARTIELLRRDTPPPPSGAADDVGDLIVPYCLGDVSADERARVVRAMAADPHVLDEVLATRRALRAAGVVLEPAADRGVDGGTDDVPGGTATGGDAVDDAERPLAVVRGRAALGTPADGRAG